VAIVRARFGFALVAQLDRASDFESEGREFESLRARQNIMSNKALNLQLILRITPPGSCPRCVRKLTIAPSEPDGTASITLP
jgi:hypothetical protein